MLFFPIFVTFTPLIFCAANQHAFEYYSQARSPVANQTCPQGLQARQTTCYLDGEYYQGYYNCPDTNLLCCETDLMCCGDLGCAPVGSDCCPSWFCYPGYTCCDDYCCPTESSATTAPASAETVQPYSNLGGCNLNGDTISGTVNCNGNKNTQNSAGTLRVNHILLVCCIATVALFLLVNGDNNTGGCSFSGGNVSDVNCSGNTNNVNEPKPNVASSLSVIDMRWLMILCIILNLGLFVGADTAGGCVINGGDVQNLNCSGNTQNNINGNVTVQPSTAPSNEYSNGLSPGAIVGIALAAVSVAIALLTFGAAIVNKDAVVGPDRRPVRHFKRVALYRIVEGCTLLFGCGTLGGLERAMGRFVQRGGK